MAVVFSVLKLELWNFGNLMYSKVVKATPLCDFLICLVKNPAIKWNIFLEARAEIL
jgi:hypothetical protein